MKKRAIFFLSLITFLGCCSCWLEDLRVYDQDWNLRYRVQDGRIYDQNWQPKGWIKGERVYDKEWELRYRIEGNRIYDADWNLKGHLRGMGRFMIGNGIGGAT